MKISAYDWTEADLIGGNAAIDFVNTVSHWAGDQVDRLGDPAAFGQWAALAGLLYGDDLERLDAELSADPKGANDFYTEMTKLRAALYRIFFAAAEKAPADDHDLDLLNDWKVRAARHCAIRQDRDGFRRACADEAPALERAMRQIFDAAETLLLSGRLDRLRICGGDDCEWMFLDLSKNGKRRWCSMATCGNEHKVKAFRKRKKEAA